MTPILNVKIKNGKYFVYLGKRYIGFIEGNIFWKPYNVIYRKKNSIGMEELILRFLAHAGVELIRLQIPELRQGYWFEVPTSKWLMFPDFTIKYGELKQNHLYLSTIEEWDKKVRLSADVKRKFSTKK